MSMERAFSAAAHQTVPDPTFLARVLECMGDAVVVQDLKGRVIYWSDVAGEMFQVKPEQAVGRYSVELVSFRWLRESEEQVAHEALALGLPWRGEVVVSVGGGERIVDATVTTMLDAGVVVGLVAVLRDGTARHRREARLTERSADFATLIELLPLPVLIGHDAACTLITGNSHGAALLGMAPGSNMSQSAPPGQLARDHVVRRDGRVLATPELPMQYAGAHNITVRDPELEVVFADGEVKYITGYATPLHREDGSVRGVLGVYVDVTEQRRRNMAQRLFARINADLGAGLDEQALLAQLAGLLLPDLADFCMIDMLDQSDTLVRVAISHAAPRRRLVLSSLAASLPTPRIHGPGRVMIEGGDPILVTEVTSGGLDRVALDEGHLALLRALAPRSVLLAPMRGRRGVLGVLTLAMDGSGRAYSSDDLHLAMDVAARAALLIDNARLYAAERTARAASEAAAARAMFLADAGALLAGELNYEQTLQQLANLAVPRFADLCVVYLAERGGVRRCAVAHADPTQEERLMALQRQAPLVTAEEHPAMIALRTGRAVLDPELPDSLVRDTPTEGGLLDSEELRGLVPSSHIVVPLTARQRVIGAISFGISGSGRRYDADDVALAEELALRAALAIDNVRLYRDSQEAVRIRDTFLSIASHELKTPLTSLLGQAQLLQRRMLQEHGASERDRRAINTVVQQSQRLSQLISAMLDISRLETGQLALVREPLDLSNLAQQVIEEIQPTLERHSVSCEPPDEPVVVLGDAVRLVQVLQNLIQNAIKYSPEGGPVLVRVSHEGAWAALRVSDRGIGIPAEAQPQLFERFYRADREAARHISGLGVGLYVVREVVALHGGQVAVESKVGEGSTFTVLLPLAEAET